MPGAGFQKWAAEANTMVQDMINLPYEAVKAEMVSWFNVLLDKTGSLVKYRKAGRHYLRLPPNLSKTSQHLTRSETSTKELPLIALVSHMPVRLYLLCEEEMF